LKEVASYHIDANDGEVGHVEEFIIDDEQWTIRYMVVNTRNWLPGRKVLVSPDWIQTVDWPEKRVAVKLSRDAIKNGPKYEPTSPVNVSRVYELELHDFYGRPYYWDSPS
jgi:hypothetical protein